MKRRKPSFRERYGPWAVIAGASEGIGAEIALELAGRGLDLVLVARRIRPLEELSTTLSSLGAKTRCVAGDLADRAFLQALAEETDKLEVGLLVCNAALGPIGAFVEQDEEELLRVLSINCRAPLVLARRYGKLMASRGRGGIVIMSSLSGLQGTPLAAAYSASKAFDMTLAEALWGELRPSGVDVVGICAGATRTPAYEASKPRARAFPPVMEARDVAAETVAALEGRRGPSAIAGKANRAVGIMMSRLLPRRLGVDIMGRAMRGLYE